MMRRDTFTVQPPSGDYILSTTGVTWGVRLASGKGSVMSLFAGQPDKKKVVGMLLTLAEADKTDAWEAAGPGSYRLIKAHRVANHVAHRVGTRVATRTSPSTK